MMKKIFYVFILLLSFIDIQAQYTKKNLDMYSSRYGIKAVGGAIVSRPEINYIGNQADYVVHQIELSHSLPQFSLGLFGQKRFGWIYAEGNALYSNYGMIFDVTSFSIEGTPERKMKEKFGYVDLQIMGGIQKNGFRIGVGPVMHILVNHSSELTSLTNYNQKLRDVSYGFSGAIGYDFERISLDLKYGKAFRTIGDHIYYGSKKSQFHETPDAIVFSVAYALFK